MKQQLAHTLKTLSVFLWSRTTLTETFDKKSISRLPSYAYEPKDRKTATNRGLNAMGAKVPTSTFVISISFGTKLNILLSNPPLRQAPTRYEKLFGDNTTSNRRTRNKRL